MSESPSDRRIEIGHSYPQRLSVFFPCETGVVWWFQVGEQARYSCMGEFGLSEHDEYTCPYCHRVSYNPNDAKHSYCNACCIYGDEKIAINTSSEPFCYGEYITAPGQSIDRKEYPAMAGALEKWLFKGSLGIPRVIWCEEKGDT